MCIYTHMYMYIYIYICVCAHILHNSTIGLESVRPGFTLEPLGFTIMCALPFV